MLGRLGSLAADAVAGGVATARVAMRTGVVSPVRPDRLVTMAAGFRRLGLSPAGAYVLNAARDPDRLAVIDDREAVSYGEIDRRSSVVAAHLAGLGVGVGDAVAVMARNSSMFVVAQVAIGKLGADVLYVNTGFAAPQLGQVLAGEHAVAVVADEEFTPLLDRVARLTPRLIAWVEGAVVPPDSIAARLTAAADRPVPKLPAPGHEGRHVILTSGTTGQPKGASRHAPSPLAALASGIGLLDAIPYRGRGTTMLAAPIFHSWGLGNLLLGSLLQTTFVMTRRFDAAHVLELVETHQADTLVAVPVMCQRILEVDETRDVSSLRIVALSGSALPPALGARFMDRFGEVLYSLYGSTEVAYVSVAGPVDLRHAPGTAGRVLRGVTVRIVDDQDEDVLPGQVGRIFAGSAMSFDGYTTGEDKSRLGALAAIGDVGRIDLDGRLYVEGRDDDMIVSGGENVFPVEVEAALLEHPAVLDAAVVGVSDDEFGQALVAYVVRRPGSSVSGAALRAHVRAALATYKVPRQVVFLAELPRTESGKVIKRQLGQPG
jgi:acyl-CoA synthetase (AMP-forming)/AMP-acid ligase II